MRARQRRLRSSTTTGHRIWLQACTARTQKQLAAVVQPEPRPRRAGLAWRSSAHSPWTLISSSTRSFSAATTRTCARRAAFSASTALLPRGRCPSARDSARAGCYQAAGVLGGSGGASNLGVLHPRCGARPHRVSHLRAVPSHPAVCSAAGVCRVRAGHDLCPGKLSATRFSSAQRNGTQRPAGNAWARLHGQFGTFCSPSD